MRPKGQERRRKESLRSDGSVIRIGRQPNIPGDVPKNTRMPNRHHRRVISRRLKCIYVPSQDLKQLGRETRKHPRNQIQHLIKMVDAYGFVLPILIDDQNRVVNGWALVLAARELGIDEIPAVPLSHLNDTKLRALRIALNKITELSSWNDAELNLEIQEIFQIEPCLPLGIDVPTLDLILDGTGSDEEDDCPMLGERVVPHCRDGE